MFVDFLENLKNVEISDIILEKKSIVGLDIGDKTVGVAVTDRRCKIATSLGLVVRKPRSFKKDYEKLYKMIAHYSPGLIVFGWPLQMDGNLSQQCGKNLAFVEDFRAFLLEQNAEFIQNLIFSKWDERFSTKVVSNIMIEADLSRKRRKEVIDKTAAVYILQGAVDFMNRDMNTNTWTPNVE